MNSVFAYVFLGISLAAPVGPVNAAQLNTGIKNGFSHAWIFGFGALLGDIFYMALVYFGVGQFIDSPYIKILLWSFGCFVLIYTGIESILTLNSIKLSSDQEKRVRLRQSLSSGFLLSLLNPLTILFWLGIFGSVLAEASQNFTGNQLLLYSFAIIAGIILWDTFMAFLSSGARKFLSNKFLVIISIISSLSMLAFGIYFGIKAYQLIF
ncbi:LysE family transporter [Psychrobacillus sp. NPDC096623]|uniref:LysE family transporter n=1 Tax=Psychrobacillus sp. NPDC096623 TaxID=3364492 RepID=UPI0037FE9121